MRNYLWWLAGAAAIILVAVFSTPSPAQEPVACSTVQSWVDALQKDTPIPRHLVLTGQDAQLFKERLEKEIEQKAEFDSVLLVDLGENIMILGFTSGCLSGRGSSSRGEFGKLWPPLLDPAS